MGRGYKRNGENAESNAQNLVRDFIKESVNHSDATEYIAAIVEATRRKDRDLVISINKTARKQFEGTGDVHGRDILGKYDAMRKEITKLFNNPKQLNNVLKDAGIKVLNTSKSGDTFTMTWSYEMDGKTFTETTTFDSRVSRFPM